jgi:hypothetical protein
MTKMEFGMKRLLLLSFSLLFLMLGAWAQPSAASSFDGAHFQSVAHHPRHHHHHRAHRHHHHRVGNGA